MMSSTEKYHTDNAFRQLVDLMEAHIHQNNYTPSEMREAAMVASINYESKRIRPMTFVTEDLERALQLIHNYADDPATPR